jgi:cation diffusion facilitator CzcD-associated flavoprotein CzcO
VERLNVVVGAGLSGIAAGHYLSTDCPRADYGILGGRQALGGTWDLFRYPGLRSDSDMFTLGYSFRPWDGAKAIADGDSVRLVDHAGRSPRILHGVAVVGGPSWGEGEARCRGLQLASVSQPR